MKKYKCDRCILNCCLETRRQHIKFSPSLCVFPGSDSSNWILIENSQPESISDELPNCSICEWRRGYNQHHCSCTAQGYANATDVYGSEFCKKLFKKTLDR
jgi:hypothetical protein